MRDGRPTRPSLFAVREARRVARTAGATVFAVVSRSGARGEDESRFGRLLEELGASGADKVLCCEWDGDDAAAAAGPVEDATHGRVLLAAAQRIPPVLVLLPAGGVGAALGPPLAARLGAAFAPCADLVVAETPPRSDGRGTGRVQAVRLVAGGKQRRRLDPLEIERPVVATLMAGRTIGAAREGSSLVTTAATQTRNAPPPDVLVFAPSPAVSGGFPAPLQPLEAARHDDSAECEMASVLVLWEDESAAGALSALLRERAIADAAVVVPSRTPPVLLAHACPEIVLRIGCSFDLVGRAPRTRVVHALPPRQAAPEGALEDVDIVWEVQSERELSPPAVATLIAELTAGGERP